MIRSSNDKIRFLQIETSSKCNYKCVFCPMSLNPKMHNHLLPMNLFHKIIDGIPFFPNLEAIYLSGYNEPTLDYRLVEFTNMLRHWPLKIIILTNGSLLHPAMVKKLIKSNSNIKLDINIASVRKEVFEQVHQAKTFDIVMRNLEYLDSISHNSGIEVAVNVIGQNSLNGDEILKEVTSFFSGTSFKVHTTIPNDRAGILKNKFNLGIYNEKLKGCWLENRTQEWIHINATGRSVICCQDYFESYPIGDLYKQKFEDLVLSPSLALYNSWTTGEQEAPIDYLCRRCIFAVNDESEDLISIQKEKQIYFSKTK